MALLDSTILMCFLRKDCPLPIDPQTNKPVDRARERIQYLIKTLEDVKETIIIPAPALAESIVKSGAARQEHLDIIQKSKWFQIAPFGTRAAMEHALLVDSIGLQSESRAPRALVKFDMQIVSIARVENQSLIFSDDTDLVRIANRIGGIKVIQTHQLPLPPPVQTNDSANMLLFDNDLESGLEG